MINEGNAGQEDPGTGKPENIVQTISATTARTPGEGAATEKEALSWEETLAAAGVVTATSATSSETLEPMKAKVLFFGH